MVPTTETTATASDCFPSIVVIGGGIGGLTVAQFLRHAGYKENVHIYESRSTEKFMDQSRMGNGIHLYFQAARMLKNGGVPKIVDYVKPAHVHFRRDDGKVIVNVNRDRQLMLDPELSKTKTSCYTILRSLLCKALIDVTPPENLHCGKKFVAVERQEGSDKPLTVKFDDGTSVQADLVIGADGIHSRVASFVHEKNKDRKLVDHGGTMIQGYSTYQLEDETAEAWIMHRDGPTYGLMASVLPNGHHGSWWWISNPAKDDRTRTQTEYLHYAQEQAQKYSWSECANVMATTVPESVQSWAFLDKDPLPKGRWVSDDGRIVLLGDACHAALPTTGYGAGMTIEDAHWLVRSLGNSASSLLDSKDRIARLRQYEAKRAPWTSAIVKEGRLLVQASHTQNRLVRTLLNMGWKTGIPDKIVSRKFVRIYRRGLDETEWTEEEKKMGVLSF